MKNPFTRFNVFCVCVLLSLLRFPRVYFSHVLKAIGLCSSISCLTVAFNIPKCYYPFLAGFP